jgi:hypothetical protein
MTATAKAYKQFLDGHACPWCWACGRDQFEIPAGWFGPWFIERSHITRSPPRIEDVRAVVLLCSLCHKTSHWERIFLAGSLNPLPRLHTEHLLDLKRRFDRANYDRQWLTEHHVGTLPRCQKLPAIYLAQYRERRGGA